MYRKFVAIRYKRHLHETSEFDIMKYNYQLVINTGIKSRDDYTWEELFKAIGLYAVARE